MKKIPTPNKKFDYDNLDTSTSWAPHRIFNIGNSNSMLLNILFQH